MKLAAGDNRPCRAGALALAIIAIAGASIGAPSATAGIRAAQTIAGPDSSIEDLGNVAMSSDGTGGLVFRRRVNGKLHVFASVFRGVQWQSPQRIDIDLDPDDGLEFDSYSPRIAAGDDGRLVVVWAQDFGQSDQLYSATLDPGATMFERPVAIDLNIGEASSAFPMAAMNRNGQAYVVYRVVTGIFGSGDATIPPGYVRAELRAARYNGWTWSRFDQVLNRNAAVPVRIPTNANAPTVAIDRSGNGVVAFQEPDDGFIDRIYARRLFGGNFGLPLLASPEEYGGRPLRGVPDQISLDSGPFGNAAIAFRQAAGAASGLDRDRVFVNLLPDAIGGEGAKFSGAAVVDDLPGPGTPSGTAVAIAPAIASEQSFASLFGIGGAAALSHGTSSAFGSASVIGAAAAGETINPGIDLTPDGRTAMAWAAGGEAAGGVRLREADELGAVNDATASVAQGEIQGLSFAGSGYGDAAVAFSQSSPAGTAIGTALIDAPPQPPTIEEPVPWLRKWMRIKRYTLRWEAAVDALGGASYQVQVNGRIVGATSATAFVLPKQRDGRKRVRVIAIDALGQTRSSPEAIFSFDRTPPRLRVRRLGANRVRVQFVAGRRNSGSRLSRKSLVKWGDGRSSRLASRATHVYKRRGRVQIVAKLRDQAGNRATVKKKITL